MNPWTEKGASVQAGVTTPKCQREDSWLLYNGNQWEDALEKDLSCFDLKPFVVLRLIPPPCFIPLPSPIGFVKSS